MRLEPSCGRRSLPRSWNVSERKSACRARSPRRLRHGRSHSPGDRRIRPLPAFTLGVRRASRRADGHVTAGARARRRRRHRIVARSPPSSRRCRCAPCFALRVVRGRGAPQPRRIGLRAGAGDRSVSEGYPKRAQDGARRAPRARRRRAADRAPLRLRAVRPGARRRRQERRGAGARRPSRARAAHSRADEPAARHRAARARHVEWLAGDAAKANALAKEARYAARRRRRPVPHVLGGDVDRRHGARAAGQLEESLGSAAGRAVAGRAAGQSVPPLRRALPAFQSLSDAEAAAKRARREPRRPIGIGEARRQHACDGEGADGGIRRARAPGRAGARARGDGRRARARAQVAVRRSARASRSSTSPTSSCGARSSATRSTLSRRSLALADEYNDVGLDRDQQGEHRIRAVRPRPRERRQALRRRSARRVRAHRRHGRNRVAARRIRPISREGRRLQGARSRSTIASASSTRRWRRPRTSDRCSSCRKNTSRTRAGARSSSSIARTRSIRRSSRTRRCASASGGCSRRSFAISLLVIAVYLPQAPRQQRPPRAEEPGTQRAQQPRSADRAVQPPLFPGLHARRAGAPERRRRGEPDKPIHALLLIDIDLFKQTNDRYGHAAGDAVLVAIARRLRDTLRETDMIVRWGGEEFLVFVPATSADKLDEIAARIMKAIAMEPIEYQGNLIRVTASIGYAPMPLPPEDINLPWERAVEPRRHGALHGEAPRPQLRLRHPRAAPQRRRGDGADRAQSRVGVGERHGRDAPRARSGRRHASTAAVTPPSRR